MKKTVGELIKSTLYLMDDTQGEPIILESKVGFEMLMRQHKYSRRLSGIKEIIQSGLEICAMRNALGFKEVEKEVQKYPILLEFSEIASDIKDIESVYSQNGEIPEFNLFNKRIFLNDGADRLYFTYRPKAPVIGQSKDFIQEEIDVPDNVFTALPFYIKSILYELDEPSLAERAKTMFYEAIAQEENIFFDKSEIVIERSL